MPDAPPAGDARWAQAVGRESHRATSSGLPPTAWPSSDARLVAQQARAAAAGPRALPAASRARVEADPALGQGAGLVGEQHVDVAEVLDAHQPLDQHLASGQPAGPGRQATVTTAGSSCGVMPDGDRQGEQQRVEERPVQHDVDHEDRRGQHRRPRGPAARRTGAARPGTRSRAGARPTRRRSCRTRSPSPVATTTPRASTAVHDGAHERARPQVVQRRGHQHRIGRASRPASIHPSAPTSSHSSCAASSSRRSAGTTSPTRSAHDVAGHEVDDIDECRTPIAAHGRLVADLRVQRLDGLLGAVLVDEPEPDRQRRRSPR